MTVNDVLLGWRGVTFDGSGAAAFFIDELSGWLELPGGQYAAGESTRGHGAGPVRVRQRERVVQAGGRVLFADDSDRDSLLAELRDQMVPRPALESVAEPLFVTIASRTDSALAQLVNFKVFTEVTSWASGGVPWKAQWLCTDPRIFGSDITVTAPLVTATTGALLPQQLPFQLPDQPIGGQVSVTNPGTDPEGSPAVITLTGTQSGTVGVTNVSTGRSLVYALALGSSDVLVIDTESGGARLNGEYRPPAPFSDTVSSLRARPGVNVYRALGTPGAGSPTISVTVRPASW